MKLKTFLGVIAVLAAVFGLILLLSPSTLLGPNGLTLDAAGTLMARGTGTILLGVAVINWMARADVNSVVTKGVLLGNVVLHGLSLLTDGQAVMNGTMNQNGWGSVVIHVVLGGGALYFYLKHPAKSAA